MPEHPEFEPDEDPGAEVWTYLNSEQPEGGTA